MFWVWGKKICKNYAHISIEICETIERNKNNIEYSTTYNFIMISYSKMSNYHSNRKDDTNNFLI